MNKHELRKDCLLAWLADRKKKIAISPIGKG